MIPGPAKVLICPFCGGKKEVMSLLSGNTFGATVWSDTRRDFPMLPEVSPIQMCTHCHKYYFIDQAKSECNENAESFELGELTYADLKEAHRQLTRLSLNKIQRWILNHQLFMAYNDNFRRNPECIAFPPEEEDIQLYHQTIEELLNGIEHTSAYELFHAELLRESGRFAEAKVVLERHDVEEDRWVVDAMMKHIDALDTAPFLLMKDGKEII